MVCTELKILKLGLLHDATNHAPIIYRIETTRQQYEQMYASWAVWARHLGRRGFEEHRHSPGL